MRARLVIKETTGGLGRNLSLTVAVVITVAIALTMSGVGLLIRNEVRLIEDTFINKINVSIYLCGKTSLEPTCQGRAVTQQQRDGIRADLGSMPEVRWIRYESTAMAFENYKRQFKSTPDLVKNVDPSALPESFIIKLQDPRKFRIIEQRFGARPGVQQVQDQNQILDKLFRLLHGFQQGAFFAAAILAAAAGLLIFNAIRIAAYNRRRETGIMRLVGASRFYVEMPFLLEGAVVGLVGGLVGSGLLALFKYVVIDRQLRPNIRSLPFIDWGWAYTLLPLLGVAAIVVSMLASFVTISWYLRRT